MSVKKANFDTLRSLAFGSISGTYAAVGIATAILPRIVCITNDTDVAMIFSVDNTNSVGNLYLPAQSFKLFDLTANMVPNHDDGLELPQQLTFYVKQFSGAATLGGVFLEYVYGT